MFTYFLFFTLFFMCIISLSFFKWDILSPNVVILAVYVIGAFFLLIQKEKWDANIGSVTYTIIVAALIEYTLIGAVLTLRHKARLSRAGSGSSSDITENRLGNKHELVVDKKIAIMIILIELIVTFKFFHDIKNGSSAIGSFASITQMISLYRNAQSTGTLVNGLSSFSKVGYVFMTAIAYIYIYILINNIFFDKFVVIFRRNSILYLVPIFLFCMCSLLSGGRNPILKLIMAAIVINYYFLVKNTNFNFNKKIKIIFKLFFILAVVLILFSQLRALVGRTSDYAFVDYISKYIGAPIELFDLFMKQSAYGANSSNIVWGQETFVSLWRFMGRILDSDNLSNLLVSKNWLVVNGFQLGNVYTPFREYCNDFGILGIFILTAIHSFVYNSMYLKIFKSYKKISLSNEIIWVIFYAYISDGIFYFSIDDRFFQFTLSPNTLFFILIVIILIHTKGFLYFRRIP
ncbi:O-antigen polymerase [Liquorilactobacillus mali]|uniref:O-antigen polymerase n=1 Tax=Liquorilactobacillus mali TaxID=1618 RepID=UPI00264B746B|nr:O-antigen polymerase [Liquorilactobacillus mali]MDN7145076.1 O-antigen polymerase [Liquorilactobacillus mali]